jgi:mannose/fructose-specific phosphotransferase system component IIA
MLVRGIIIAHADLAKGFVATVEAIIGPQENMVALSNSQYSREDLDRLIKGYLDDGMPTVIFTDFAAGSTYAAARLAINAYCQPGQATCDAISGVNLPMLLSFITKRENLTFPTLVETLRQDGHRGIQ